MRKLTLAALTLLIGTVGGLVLLYFGFPAAFLTGSALALTVAVVLGVPVRLPVRMRDPSFAILGLMIGSAVKPDTLSALSSMPVAVVGLVFAVLAAVLSSFLVLRLVARWDVVTALCGSIPGALQTTLIVAIDAGARMDRVVMAQALRLLVLISIVPLLFGSGSTPDLDVAAAQDSAGLWRVALSISIAMGSAAVGKRIGVPSAAMMTPLLVAAILSASGVFEVAIPGWLAAVAFVSLGASVAERFAAVKRDEVGVMLLHATLSFLAAAGSAMAVAAAVAAVLGMPVGAVFLAYAPGGLDAMIPLTFLLNYDIAFVATLQVTRFVLLSAMSPLVVGRVARRYASRPGRAEAA